MFNYELARKNILANKLTDRISLLLAGCAGTAGEMTIDPLHESNIYDRLVESKSGIKIPVLTLSDILINDEISPGKAVLKMDCEGCEYDVILSSSIETLRFFTHIQLEYHLGYKNLKDKLEKCGFKVFVTRPLLQHSKFFEYKTTYTGYLYATRTR